MRLKLSGLLLRESTISSPAFAGCGTGRLAPPRTSPAAFCEAVPRVKP